MLKDEFAKKMEELEAFMIKFNQEMAPVIEAQKEKIQNDGKVELDVSTVADLGDAFINAAELALSIRDEACALRELIRRMYGEQNEMILYLRAHKNELMKILEGDV